MAKPILLALLAISWIISGLILNAFQFLIYLLVKPVDRGLFRRINYYLTYSSWSQQVALAEHWAGFRVRIFFKDESSLKMMARQHSIGICNHTYELDWIYLWMTMDKFNFLANGKAFVKDSIKWLPVMGWSWIVNEMVFLKRNAAKDLATISNCLNQFGEYLDPTMTVLFSEGTRFTPAKHEAAIKFAKENSFESFKYHLNPRAKGFAHCIKHIKNETNNNNESSEKTTMVVKSAKNTARSIKSIYNVQIAFNENDFPRSKLNFYSMMNQVPVLGDIYLERIAIESIDSSSDEKLSQFLNDLYRSKDKLMDYHRENNKFPGILHENNEPRLIPALNLYIWAIVIHSTILYTLIKALIYGNTVLASSIIATLVILSICLLLLIRSTRSKHGSSYGAKPKSNTKVN